MRRVKPFASYAYWRRRELTPAQARGILQELAQNRRWAREQGTKRQRRLAAVHWLQRSRRYLRGM